MWVDADQLISGQLWSHFLLIKEVYIKRIQFLSENNQLITNQQEVCTIFNDFFVNVAKNIGDNSVYIDDSHPSISNIKKNNSYNQEFDFTPVDSTFIEKQINNLNVKKATGHDGISAKLIKLAKPTVIEPLTTIVNTTLNTSVFPDQLKIAEVKPLHKKNSLHDKGNYRPVSILPIFSKIFERAMNKQVTDYFGHHFNIYLSAFRPGYGCSTTLLKVIEDWKQALDENKYIAAILIDLSKAFDCLPHDLLSLKNETLWPYWKCLISYK